MAQGVDDQELRQEPRPLPAPARVARGWLRRRRAPAQPSQVCRLSRLGERGASVSERPEDAAARAGTGRPGGARRRLRLLRFLLQRPGGEDGARLRSRPAFPRRAAAVRQRGGVLFAQQRRLHLGAHSGGGRSLHLRHVGHGALVRLRGVRDRRAAGAEPKVELPRLARRLGHGEYHAVRVPRLVLLGVRHRTREQPQRRSAIAHRQLRRPRCAEGVQVAAMAKDCPRVRGDDAVHEARQPRGE
mmetsp:Transcript_9540/g.28388  ORF Transcript_9540/g.28388 Transcript_9540/m.28388 type:complete len:244 (-) Transcript_9540:279-1010(-)